MPSSPEEMQDIRILDAADISITATPIDSLLSVSSSLQNLDFKSFNSSNNILTNPTLKRSSAINTSPPRTHHTTHSTSSLTSTYSDTTTDTPSSDFEFASASDEDDDARNRNLNKIEGSFPSPMTGGKLKRTWPSTDTLCDTRAFGVHPSHHQPADTTRPMRPLKRARIDNHASHGNADGDGIRIFEVQDSLVSRNSGDASKWEDNSELPPRTRTPPLREQTEADRLSTLTATPPRMSVSPCPSPAHSPLSRPAPPTRFQSSSSCSTLASGSSFPKTPPPSNYLSNGSGAGSPPAGPSCAFVNNGAVLGSGPTQFWFEDGDLVLLVPSSVRHVSAQSPPHYQFGDPFAPSSHPPRSLDTSCIKQEETFALAAFRIHAARLAQASSAFASALLTQLPQNPGKQDSVRAAAEIASRLNEYRRSGRCLEPFYRETSNAQEGHGHGMDCEYEVPGGCPAIRLVGDAPKDWVVALEAIYEPLSFQVRPIVFDALASALRISTRYGLHTLRDWALAQLRTTWPSQVERMSPVALPHAADAIALARSCDVRDILPAAFYALSVQRWRPMPVQLPSANAVSAAANPNASFNLNTGPGFGASATASKTTLNFESSGTDGGRAHTVLDPMDLRRLVMGREALQDVLVEIVSSPLTIGKSMWDEDEMGSVEVKCEMYGSGAHLFPSPSPTHSPKMFPAATSAAATQNGSISGVPSPPLSNVSSTTATTLVSGSGYHQPTPQPFSIIPSFSPSNSTGYGFPGLSSSACTSTEKPPDFNFCSPDTSGCQAALGALWRERLATDPRRPWGIWLNRELYRLATLPRGNEPGAGHPFSFESSETKTDEGASGKGKCNAVTGIGIDVCANCWEVNRRLALWRLDWLCAAIPKLFML